MNERLSARTGKALSWRFATLVGGKAIALARTLILARLLVPEDFGLMAIALVTVHTASRVTDLGMTPALVQHTSRSIRQLDTAWTIGLLRAIVLALVLASAAPWIAQLFAEPRAIWILRSTALIPVLRALSSIAVADLIRDLDFSRLAALSLVTLLTEAVVSIALAPTYGVRALVAGALAGPAIAVPLSYLLAPHRPKLMIDRRDSTMLIHFGRWILLSGVLATICSLVVQVTISRKLGTASLGIYYLAVRLTDIPVQISGKVVEEVAFPMFARLQADLDRTVRAFRSLVKGLLAVVSPISILLIAFAEPIVSNLLGPSWEGAAPIIQILAAGSLLGLYGDACTPLFKGRGFPRYATFLELIQVAVLVVAVVPLTDAFQLAGTAASWLPATLAAQVAASILVHKMLPTLGFEPPTKAILLVAVPTLTSILWIAIGRGFDSPMGTIAVILGYSVTILTMFWILDRRTKLGLVDDAMSLFPQLKPMLATIRRDPAHKANEVER